MNVCLPFLIQAASKDGIKIVRSRISSLPASDINKAAV